MFVSNGRNAGFHYGPTRQHVTVHSVISEQEEEEDRDNSFTGSHSDVDVYRYEDFQSGVGRVRWAIPLDGMSPENITYNGAMCTDMTTGQVTFVEENKYITYRAHGAFADLFTNKVYQPMREVEGLIRLNVEDNTDRGKEMYAVTSKCVMPLIVICGPSGVGKSSISKLLLRSEIGKELFSNAVSYTTRPMRQGEVDGEDYVFLTPEEFNKKVIDCEMYEHVTHAGNQYGISRASIDNAVMSGKMPVIDLNMDGCESMDRVYLGPMIRFFIMPPRDGVPYADMKWTDDVATKVVVEPARSQRIITLLKRLNQRATESEDEKVHRLTLASRMFVEYAAKQVPRYGTSVGDIVVRSFAGGDYFHYTLVNKDVGTTMMLMYRLILSTLASRKHLFEQRFMSPHITSEIAGTLRRMHCTCCGGRGLIDTYFN